MPSHFPYVFSCPSFLLMFSYKPFRPEDIFQMDYCNLDPYTENFYTEYYLQHMNNNNEPFYCVTYAINCHNNNTANSLTKMDGSVYGYVFAFDIRKKLNVVEEKDQSTLENNKKSSRSQDSTNEDDGLCVVDHSENSVLQKIRGVQMHALSVSFCCRRCGIATELVNILKSTQKRNYIKLFVRESNTKAIAFYLKEGFCLKRIIKKYYSRPSESALEMILTNGFKIEREYDIHGSYLSDNED